MKTKLRIFSRNHSVAPLRRNKKGKSPIGDFPFPVLVNFGSRSSACYRAERRIKEKGGVVLNSPSRVGNASNKLYTKILLEEKGVPTPKFCTFQATLGIVTKTKRVSFKAIEAKMKFPLVAKLKKGYGGNGMKLLKTLKDVKKWRKGKSYEELNEYILEEVFQPDLSKSMEFRISCSPLLIGTPFELERKVRVPQKEGDPVVETRKFKDSLGAIVILQKKMKNEAVERGAFGRNLNLGNSVYSRFFPRETKFGKINFNLDEGIHFAMEAVKACGLDYGGVDILFDKESGEWTILEVNSAPSMGSDEHSYTLGQWTRALEIMITKKNLQNK